ncbi:MAG: anthranilate synthase component I family protein [Bacteroidetes bacterium]|nr:anthranilate synthase component I family protein [Bacteroidota bacterium]MBS1939697.1 anthranilate synthase component I family protein [Bacteroidota bacterium]
MTLPWNGTINWLALDPFDLVLARRTGDHGQWLIGAGCNANEGVRPEPWTGTAPCFGYAGYDLKNRFESLESRHPGTDGFDRSAWWRPQYLVKLADGQAVLEVEPRFAREGNAFLELLIADPGPLVELAPATWLRTTPQEQYLARVKGLLGSIQWGDIYEVNYCTQRTAVLPDFDPYTAFARLLAYSDAPFAAFLRHGGNYALCASPERFLRIEDGRISTYPMKGTRPRGRSMAEDQALAEELANDPKERSENIMALDVARNDLGRIASPGTVRVDELCAVKSYPNVHQLVSTASAELRPGVGPMDILRAAFPMASMTGAPKVRAMQLIDGAEDMRRGIFSGTMGYFLPDGTADLNVVIRTVTWKASTGRASLISGGAITAASTPEQEFAECEHKARSVLNAFGHAC